MLREIAQRFRYRLSQVESLEVLLAILATVWAWLLWVNFPYLPINGLFFQNADVLLIEQVGRDLNSGGQLFQWRLTQAPYLFPDIFAARFLSLFRWSVGSVGVVYQVLFGCVLILVWSFVLPGKKKSYFYWSTILVYGLSFWATLYGDSISPYFGLIGHHSGVGLFVPVLYYLAWWCCCTGNPVLLFLLTIATCIGAMSDGLILFVFIIPVSLYFLLLLLRHSDIGLQSISKTFLFIGLGFLLSRTFSYTTPFPQDREFSKFFIGQFPKLAGPSFHAFISDVVAYPISSVVAGFLALVFVAAYVVLCKYLIKTWKQTPSRSEGCVPITCFGLVCALPMVVGSQIMLGLYTSLASSRQWAMLIFATILMAIYLLREYPIAYRAVTSAMAIFLVVAMYLPLKGKHGRLPAGNPYEAMVACAMREFPVNTAFVADYWASRPIEMYSGGALKSVPVNGTGPVFTNASKIAEIRTLQPHFAVTGFSVKRAEYIAQFGPPDREVCAQPGAIDSRMEIMDYTRNAAFISNASQKAAVAY